MTRDRAYHNRHPIDLSAVIPWENSSGETVPAYGVVQFRTAYSGVSFASKPSEGTGLFYVNGLAPVTDGSRGDSLVWNKPRPVLLDGSPGVGDEVGPVAGQWYMSSEGSGFRVLRQPEDGVGVVVQVGGGSGAGHKIWFEIDEVLCPDGYEIVEKTLIVTPTWYTGGCEDPIPGADPYTGQVEVYDLCSYLMYYVDAELPGKIGRASYMYPRTGTCEPRWIIDDICHQPECA